MRALVWGPLSPSRMRGRNWSAFHVGVFQQYVSKLSHCQTPQIRYQKALSWLLEKECELLSARRKIPFTCLVGETYTSAGSQDSPVCPGVWEVLAVRPQVSVLSISSNVTLVTFFLSSTLAPGGIFFTFSQAKQLDWGTYCLTSSWFFPSLVPWFCSPHLKPLTRTCPCLGTPLWAEHFAVPGSPTQFIAIILIRLQQPLLTWG